MYLLSVCLENTEYLIDPITENDGVNLHIKAITNKKFKKDLRERNKIILYYTKRERERDDQQ